jgi:hypothetical protein
VVILASTHGRGDYNDFTFKVMEATKKMKFISIIIVNKRMESNNVTYNNTISLKYHNVRHKVECIWHIDLKEHPMVKIEGASNACEPLFHILLWLQHQISGKKNMLKKITKLKHKLCLIM